MLARWRSENVDGGGDADRRGVPERFPDAVNTKLAHAWQAVEEVRDVLKR